MQKVRIIIEGPQGVGKTWLANLVAKALEEEGINQYGEDLNIQAPKGDYGDVQIITTNIPNIHITGEV